MCGFLLLRLCWSLNWPFLPQKCSIPYVAVVRMLCSAGVANIGSCYFCIPLKLQHSQKIPPPLCFLNFFFPFKWNPYGMVCPSQCQGDGMQLVSTPLSPARSVVNDGEKLFHVKAETLDSRALVSDSHWSHLPDKLWYSDPQFCYAWDRYIKIWKG